MTEDQANERYQKLCKDGASSSEREAALLEYLKQVLISRDKLQVLDKNLTDFLADKRKSDGGDLAKLADSDMDQLHSIFEQVIKIKFESNMYGSYPVEFELFNKHKEHRVAFDTGIPYESDLKNPFKLTSRLGKLLFIQRCISNELSIETRIIENGIIEAESKKKEAANG